MLLPWGNLHVPLGKATPLQSELRDHIATLYQQVIRPEQNLIQDQGDQGEDSSQPVMSLDLDFTVRIPLPLSLLLLKSNPSHNCAANPNNEDHQSPRLQAGDQYLKIPQMGILPVDIRGVRGLLDSQLFVQEARQPSRAAEKPPQPRALLVPPCHHRTHILLISERHHRKASPTNGARSVCQGLLQVPDLSEDLVLVFPQLTHLAPGLGLGLPHGPNGITLEALVQGQRQVCLNLRKPIPQAGELLHTVPNCHLDHLYGLPGYCIISEEFRDLLLLGGILGEPQNLDSVVIGHRGVVIKIVTQGQLPCLHIHQRYVQNDESKSTTSPGRPIPHRAIRQQLLGAKIAR
mmetsp:Transcript_40979/g.92436  ORF Transcript_40979/g.92436 Transcript_40979/m.92436 type:complete len:347 (-) Transcript_40979:202-1242(-)